VSNLQPTNFGLIRHATTLWNEKKMIQGQLDSPLSTAGQQMATNWGYKLASYTWQRIICSDLGRTRETTELINQTLKLPVHMDKRLREQDWGEWSGLSLAEVKETQQELLQSMVRSGWYFQPPKGESRKQVLKRSLDVLSEAHASWPGEAILIVCHEGVIKCLLYHLTKRKFLPEERPLIKPKHLHFLAQDDNTLSLEELNCMQL
jgi:broad specificity phosphatase PhoE